MHIRCLFMKNRILNYVYIHVNTKLKTAIYCCAQVFFACKRFIKFYFIFCFIIFPFKKKNGRTIFLLFLILVLCKFCSKYFSFELRCHRLNRHKINFWSKSKEKFNLDCLLFCHFLFYANRLLNQLLFPTQTNN